MKLIAILASLAMPTVIASVYNKLTLEQMVKKADFIVQATVKSLNPIDDKGKTWTIYSLEVKEFIRGEAKDMEQYEGSPSFRILGGRNLVFKGAPTFKRGDQVVLFLYQKQSDSPIVGFNQGAYFVQPSKQVADLNGKPVILDISGKKTEANIDNFIAELKRLVGTK